MIYTLSCVDFIHIMIIKCCDLWNPEDCNEIPEVEGTEVNNKTAPVPKANKFELTFICDPLNPMLHECFFSTKAKKKKNPPFWCGHCISQ